MSEAVVAKRYADALFQIGQEKNMIDQLENELKIVKDVFKNNDQLITFLNHPRVKHEKKIELLEEAFKGLQDVVVNTLKLLVDRHRVTITPSIIDHFIDKVNDAKGIAEATVYSVRELTDQELGQLKESLAKRFQKNEFKLTNIVDPSILGGLKIRLGNTIYDGTISGKLSRIERNIVTANK